MVGKSWTKRHCSKALIIGADIYELSTWKQGFKATGLKVQIMQKSYIVAGKTQAYTERHN